MFLSLCLWFISRMCARTWAHACYLYRISGSIHVGFGNPKHLKKNTHSYLFSTARLQNRSVSGAFSKPHSDMIWNTLKCQHWWKMGAERLRVWYQSFLSSVSNLHEMLRCHVTVSTVCWQKCHFQSPIAWILSEQAGDSRPNLSQQGVHDVFRRFLRRMMCEYLCLSRLQINRRCCDTDGVAGLLWHSSATARSKLVSAAVRTVFYTRDLVGL